MHRPGSHQRRRRLYNCAQHQLSNSPQHSRCVRFTDRACDEALLLHGVDLRLGLCAHDHGETVE